MYALILIRYRLPMEEVAKVTDEHRAYLRELKADGTLIAAGPMDPRLGGAILVRVPDDNVQQAPDRRARRGSVFQEGHCELRADSVESGASAKKTWTNCKRQAQA